MALPGRIYNGVETVPVVIMRTGIWTVGRMALVFPAMSILFALIFQSVSALTAVASAVIPLVLALFYIPWMNRINPGIRLSEITAMRLYVDAARHRRVSTRVDH